MKDKELLKKIYRENKALNRNIQSLTNLCLVSLLSKSAEEAKIKDNKRMELVAEIGMILVMVAECISLVRDIIIYKQEKIEDKIENLEKETVEK